MSLFWILIGLVGLGIAGSFAGGTSPSDADEDDGYDPNAEDARMAEIVSSDQNDHYWDPPGDDIV